MYVFFTLSILLAFSVSIFNVSRPYVSYSWFIDYVKQFTRPYASIPEAFYLRPRIEQYFNSEFFWYEPYQQAVSKLRSSAYKKVVENIEHKNKRIKVTFDVMDDFEYPLWVLLKESKINYQVIPKVKFTQSDFLIKTSPKQEEIRNLQNLGCFKTSIKYGYACLYKRVT